MGHKFTFSVLSIPGCYLQDNPVNFTNLTPQGTTSVMSQQLQTQLPLVSSCPGVPTSTLPLLLGATLPFQLHANRIRGLPLATWHWSTFRVGPWHRDWSWSVTASSTCKRPSTCPLHPWSLSNLIDSWSSRTVIPWTWSQQTICRTYVFLVEQCCYVNESGMVENSFNWRTGKTAWP